MQFKMNYNWNLTVISENEKDAVSHTETIKRAFNLPIETDPNKGTNKISFLMEANIDNVYQDIQKVQMYLLLLNSKYEIANLPGFKIKGSLSSRPVFDLGPGMDKVGLGSMMGDTKEDFDFKVEDNIFYRNGKIAFSKAVEETKSHIIKIKKENSPKKTKSIKP